MKLTKAERTKSLIIEKTATIFNKKGYAGTSLSDLTNATNLTKGSIYGNFKNKEEVAIDALKYNISQITNAFSAEIILETSSLNKLLVYPRVYRKIYKDVFKNGGCPILNTLSDADDTYPELLEIASNTITSWKNSICKLIIAGISNKELSPNTNPENIAEIIISLFEGGGLLAKSTGQESFMLNAIDHVEKLILSIMV